jgi:chemotaxis protein CheD
MVAVGVGEFAVSARGEDTLVTYGLGSCIGVTIWDPAVKVGGMLHFMLPDSHGDAAKAKEQPALYADTGIPLLFRSAYQLGAEKRRLVVRVAGGAHVLDDEGVFNIGKRNFLAMKKIFWKAGVMIHAMEVGGNRSRTLRLEVGSGRLMLQEAGAEAREMGLRHCA